MKKDINFAELYLNLTDMKLALTASRGKNYPYLHSLSLAGHRLFNLTKFLTAPNKPKYPV